MNSFLCSRSDCDNKTEYGYCKSTVCIKPLNWASGYIPEVVHGPDVAPVVHGYWITCIRHEHYPSGKAYEDDYCSVCGKRGSREDDYCPRCGARMDVEQKKYEAQKRDLENARRSMEEAITTPVVDVTRWQYPQLTEEAKKDAVD